MDYSQAPLSMEFSRQGYWSGFPFPIPGNPPDPGIELVSLMSPASAGGFFAIPATFGTSLYLYQHQSRGRKEPDTTVGTVRS